MKVKRLTAMFLMFSLVFMLIGCGSEQTPSSEGNNTPDRDSESNVLDSEAQNIPVEEAKILPDLPERDFGGHEFIIITRDYTANLDLPQEIGAEEETGAPINDAIYRRNKKIEEQFNVTVKEILHDGDMAASVNREIMTGDNSYELITGHLNALGIMAQRGNLLDLKKVNYLDLGRPWYDQNAAADLSIGNRLFFAIGELQVSNKDGTWSVLFNKKLFADLGFEDPYVLAREGKWTMDKMFEFATEGTRDLNGDGAMGEEDQWGMLGETFNIWALMNGSGTRLVQKDENDLPFYSGYTQRDIDIFEKGAAYLSDKSKSLLPSFRPTEPKFIEVMFQTGRVLFYFTSMSRVTLHRNADVNFGILPTPKYEETQEKYVNTASVWLASGMGIPVTLSGDALDRTAILMEALNAESMYTLTPAYYDIQLKTKLTRDDESSEMLDIIFANRVYSTPQLYDWGGMISTIVGLIDNSSPNFVTAMERIESRIVRDIEKTIAAYDE